MDPLSLTASLIAVIQVSQSVLLACYRIRSFIKDADGDIARIITDVESLEATLEELRAILPPSDSGTSIFSSLSLDDGPGGGKRPASAACHMALRACESTLKELSEKLQPLAKPSIKSKLKFGLESSTIQRKLDEISKLKATLQLALSAYQTRVLGEQSQKIDQLGDSSKRAAVLVWYKTSDPEQNHKLSRSRHEPNTSTWIFDNESFMSWTAEPGQCLWLHGIPGAGKTVLCSTIIHHMHDQYAHPPGVKVAYFYFDFSDAKKQTVSNLCKSIIYQLISGDENISDSAAALLYEKCNNGLTEPALDELMGVILAEISRTERTIILIDALDECPGPEEERLQFFDIFFKSALPKNLSLLITSRKEHDIAAALEPSVSHTVCIQSSAVDADVRIHISNSIARDARLSKWKPAIRDEILDAIVNGSNGMFRWAVCQLDVMKKCLTPAMVHSELKRMPATLEQTYDRILQAVPSLHRPFVQSALHWLAFSERPLLIEELAEGAVIQPDEDDFDVERARFFDENMILELCGSLISSSDLYHDRAVANWLTDKVNAEGGWSSASLPYDAGPFHVVSLSHFSVKEYIASDALKKNTSLTGYHASQRLANDFLARCCLFYLLHFNGGEVAPTLEFREWPLLEYSARNWMSHWQQSALEKVETSTTRDLAEQLFDSLSTGAFTNWLNVSRPDANIEPVDYVDHYRRDMKSGPQNYPQPLYWAAFLGDQLLVEWLVEQGADMSEAEGRLGSALGAAAYFGRSNIVGYLLQHGADPNLPNRKFGNFLQIAALGGHIETVKQLLDAGAKVNAEGGAYNTALVAAASKEHYNVVSLLVKHSADLNIGSRTHGSSLYQAALAGDSRTVVALLGAGADINFLGDADGTPLYAASKKGSIPVVQLLLRKGADVNKGGRGEYGYPISVAAAEGHTQVVTVLIRAGANVNVLGGRRGVTALEAAIESRDMATFRAVLDAGADPNVEAELYKNCFHAAIWTGEFEQAKILLDRDADFEDVAFLSAVQMYKTHPWFLDRLLERGGDVNAWDEDRGSALHEAMAGSRTDAFEILLSRGAYPDAVSEKGSVMLIALEQSRYDEARMLLQYGADPSRQIQADTPFTMAVYSAGMGDKDSLDLLDLLLDKGADVNDVGGLAAYWAVQTGNKDLLRYLVKNGANLDLVNHKFDCSPLHFALQENKRDMVDLLLLLGANVDGPPGDRGYCIHYALMSQDEEMVKYILCQGAPVRDSAELWFSSIHQALSAKLGRLIPVLITYGADINALSPAQALQRWSRDVDAYKLLLKEGATLEAKSAGRVFIELVSGGKMDDIKMMLADGMSTNVHNEYQTPLREAAWNGRVDLIDLLLEHGADINYAVNDILTPLTAACRRSNISITEALLERGADPNVVCQECVTPLSSAARTSGNLQLVELLLDHGADVGVGDSYVFSSAIFGGLKILARLFEQPITDTARERHLGIALQHAAHWALLDVVTWLLDQGADANYQGGRYGCPLSAAVSNMHLTQSSTINDRKLTVNLLLSRGAEPNRLPVANEAPNYDPDLKAPTHAPPLVAALTNRAAKLAQTLLDAGADPNLQGGNPPTALQAAAFYAPSMVGPLLAAGADPTTVTATGPYGTALHAAAYAHNGDGIAALLAAGADVGAVAGKYGTPLHAAAKRETTGSGWTAGRDSLRAAKALVEAGADPHARGGKYDTVAQIAAKSGNLEVLRWLVDEIGVDVDVRGGGRYGSVRDAAVRKGRWGVVTYLERRFGPFRWSGKYQSHEKWKNFTVTWGEKAQSEVEEKE